MQSCLLILTFIWALRERKGYRVADRFSGIALEFVTTALDRLYENTQSLLESIYADQPDATFTAPLKAQINSNFAVRMYHTRTVVLNRLSCFPSVNLAPVNEAFEEMEDEFALKVETLSAEEKHPEFLTSVVGKGSGKIIAILLSHEQKLAGLGRSHFGFRKSM